MIGKICGLICLASFLFGCAGGRLEQMSRGVIESASSAVELTLSLMGGMCLWNGIMNVADRCGAVKKMASVMLPILKLLFPDACKKQNGVGEIASSLCANLFGLGNAATPLAINAMKRLGENNGGSEIASDDMIVFAVLGCSSLDIIPTTLIALRTAAGSSQPFEIIVPVWICSFTAALVSVLLVKSVCAIRRRKNE